VSLSDNHAREQSFNCNFWFASLDNSALRLSCAEGNRVNLLSLQQLLVKEIKTETDATPSFNNAQASLSPPTF